MKVSEIGLFLGQWVRAPRHIGSVVPSGRALAAAIARHIEPNKGFVVELGAGTGAVTQALLQHGIPRSKLVLVELEQKFCDMLKTRYPGLRVLHGDARSLRTLLAEAGVDRVAVVVSSLPLRSLTFSTQRAVLRESVQVLAAGGDILQFTYIGGSPVHPMLQRRLGLVGKPVGRVWLNVPPAVVWRYRKTYKDRDPVAA